MTKRSASTVDVVTSKRESAATLVALSLGFGVVTTPEIPAENSPS
jgi:hypothetical protein